jgi:hypothetical protein
MKTRICLLGLFAFAMLVVAAPRTWVLKTGETVTGDYISSGTTALVVKTGSTNCFLKISDLSTNDQAYVVEMQVAQRQARLNVEAKQMQQAGMIEFTTKLIENFPEKVDDQSGWMDAKFAELYDAEVYTRLELGFWVEDKNGDSYFKCFLEKEFHGNNFPLDLSDTKPNPLVSVITGLKRGDRVRLIGKVVPFSFYSDHRLFHIEKVEMIESAAEKKFIEQQYTTTP